MELSSAPLRYQAQHSSQTLREGIAEYYAANPDLLDPAGMEPTVQQLFKQHDAGHVIFGCDTSLRGETLIDTWTILGSTAGIKGYIEYYRHPQIYQIFSDVGYVRMTLVFLRCLPEVFRVWRHCRRLTQRWPWKDYDALLDETLDHLRSRFNIQVV